MNLDANTGAVSQMRGLGRRKAMQLGALALITFAGLSLAQLTRFVVGAGVEYSAGDVAAFDIRAPHRITYVSDVDSNRQRDLAEASISPIFTPPDTQVSRRQMAATQNVIDRIRQIRIDEGTAAEEKVTQLMAFPDIAISEPVARQVIAFDDSTWNRVGSQLLAVLDVALRSPIHPDNLDKARAGVNNIISFSLSPEEAEVVSQLASAMLVPNTNYDSAATEAARRAARENVKPIERAFEANQVIIRSGQVIGPADIEALEKMNLRRPALSATSILSALLFSLVAVLVLALSMIETRQSLFKRPVRHTALSAATLVIMLFLARWLLPGHGVLPYLAPLAAVALVITNWSGLLPGVVSALVLGGLVGLSMDKQVEFAACITLSGIVACLTLGRTERLSNFLRAGAFAGVAQALTVLAFNLPTFQSNDAPQLTIYLIASFASGVLAAGLSLVILYITGALFGVTTIVQLIELSRLSHPLLQEMVTKAPGTYHHSLMVANLAEHAAERIGADSLLTRTGAYFHDIGKMANPYFFIENQLDGLNPHDQLDPLTSSVVLQNHVSDGLKLAGKHRLPASIRAFIAQHHGTSKTNYQYARAMQESGNVDAQPFRYPGPRPQSKEIALVMLADGSEAAVRSSRSANADEMDQVIRRVFSERLSDHQLDDSDLTLREMEVARMSFLETLRGMYHPRITYPQMNQQPPAAAVPARANAGEQEWVTP
jgi:putative nucleotidyltransferase with HDIG domain